MNDLTKWIVLGFLGISGLGVIVLIAYLIINAIKSSQAQQLQLQQEIANAQYNPANTAINDAADLLAGFL